MLVRMSPVTSSSYGSSLPLQGMVINDDGTFSTPDVRLGNATNVNLTAIVESLLANVSQIAGNFTGPFGLGSTMTDEEVIEFIKNNYVNISNYDERTQIALIVAFAILILFGATGNGLVCYVVAKNPSMRTPRNIFIINLAISDLTLCLFTQPFNLMKVSMSVWTLGDFMCKFVPMLSGTNVFVSTISITAIALDRFQVIVYPTRDSMKRVGAAMALLSIWIISLLMASPLLIFNIITPEYILTVPFEMCIENPHLHYEKGAYSIASMIFQYIVPILIVSFSHARICNKLKYRMITSQQRISVNSPFQTRRNEREAKRKRKTNMLLMMIGIIFACSWMPLNVFNIMADFGRVFITKIDKKSLIFPICHLLVLSSACTNPLLYGWLNENFRREFMKVLCSPCCSNIRVICRCEQCVSNAQDRQSSVVIYTKANHTIVTECPQGGAAGVVGAPSPACQDAEAQTAALPFNEPANYGENALEVRTDSPGTPNSVLVTPN